MPLSDEECERIFDRLFPGGPLGADVLIEIAPDGWEAAPLHRVFHPTMEQVIEETLRRDANLRRIEKKAAADAAETASLVEQAMAAYRPAPVEKDAEIADLLGMCLWDIFSDNHEAWTADGQEVDIGSWRGAGDFIAGWLNARLDGSRYHYMDFYMGTAMVAHRADLTPAWVMIFGRMRMSGLDWRYSFPRLYAVDTRPLRRALGGPEPPASQVDDEAIRELQESLDREHAEAVAEARQNPPPPIVEAYRIAYGHFPVGWPPAV